MNYIKNTVRLPSCQAKNMGKSTMNGQQTNRGIPAKRNCGKVRQMERELEKLEQYPGAERNNETEHKNINKHLR